MIDNTMAKRYQREVIRIRKSNDRQYNGQKNKGKRSNNDPQNITQKTTKDRVTRTPLKTGANSGAPEGLIVHVATVVLL